MHCSYHGGEEAEVGETSLKVVVEVDHMLLVVGALELVAWPRVASASFDEGYNVGVINEASYVQSQIQEVVAVAE